MNVKKIFEKYNDFPIQVKASLWFTVCNILQKGISLLTTPLFTRLLTTYEYGNCTIFYSWYSLISIFATLNLSAGVYNNGLTKYENKRDEVSTAFLLLSSLVTGITFFIYCIGRSKWNQLFQLNTSAVYLMFIQLLFEPAYTFWMVRQRYEYKYKNVVLITIIVSVLNPLLSALAVQAAQDKYMARVFVGVIIQSLIGFYFYLHTIAKTKRFSVIKYWKYALTFNLPLIPYYLSMVVLNQIDRIMIGKFCGDDKAAIYAIAYNIAMMMTLITNAINASLTPYIYQSIKRNNITNVRKVTNYLLVLMVLLCFGVMLIAPELIRIFATKEYYEAIWIIPPVAVSVFFMFLYNLFGNIEFYYEKTLFIMVASCVGAILNGVLNAAFIPIFGYYAAGYTTLFCYTVFAVSHYVFYRIIVRKKDDVKGIYNGKIILFCSIFISILMIFTSLLYNNMYVRYTIIIVCTICMFVFRKKIIELLAMLKKRRI